MTPKIFAAAAAAVGALLISGCASPSGGSGSASGGSGNGPVTVRLGYLANITHAPALIGVKNGYFTKALGKAATLKTSVYTAGTQETTAILSGHLDAAYVGPNPAINAWQKSGGKAIRIVSGAATGGATLVVKPGTTSARQLKGQSIATPALGSTQDVAARSWLKEQGLATSTVGGGDVSVKPTAPNSAAVLEFKSGQIAGASEPSPYDVEMEQAGGTVLLSEPGVTTLLMVTQSFLSAHPGLVSDLLKAQIQSNDFIKKNPAQAAQVANSELAAYTGKPLKPKVLTPAFKEITFTDDPDEASLTTDARQAASVGLLQPVDLNGIFALGPLNKLLKAAGEPPAGG